jgi:tetratricopeptide (TPR) repeat protein
MAQAALAANRIDRAADNAQRALRLKPGWTQAWAVLGAAQYLKGEYTQALRSLAYLRNDDTLGGFGWFMSGRCYSRLGQTAKAQSAYQQAAGCGPNSPLVAHFLPSEAL